MSNEISGHIPPDELARRAVEQRRRIHQSVGELKSSITELKTSVEKEVRERLDAKRYARRHLWPLAVGGSVLALMAGYGFAGIFARR